VPPHTPLPYVIDVTVRVSDGPGGRELTATWTGAGRLLTRADVEELSDTWVRAIEALTRHAQDPEAGVLTPSDVPLAGLSQREIDRLMAEGWSMP
jgi:non-ribosomal peptide synthase protein (TIGR01720 family)